MDRLINRLIEFYIRQQYIIFLFVTFFFAISIGIAQTFYVEEPNWTDQIYRQRILYRLPKNFYGFLLYFFMYIGFYIFLFNMRPQRNSEQLIHF